MTLASLPRPTADGRSAAVVLAIALFAAYSTSANLVFLLAATVAAALAVSTAGAWLSVRRVSVRVETPGAVTEGGMARVRVVLRNEGTAEARNLGARVVLSSDHGSATASVTPSTPLVDLLPPAAERLVTLTVPLPSRGRWTVSWAAATSSGPFDLVHVAGAAHSSASSVVAVPRLLDVRFGAVSSHEQETEREELTSAAAGEGSAFRGLRPYRRGDPLKDVHWRTSARTGRLMVCEYERRLTARYYVYLDLDSSKADGPRPGANLEEAVRLAATLGRQLQTENVLAQILVVGSDDGPAPPVFTAADAGRMLRFLGETPWGPTGGLLRLVERSLPAVEPDSFLVFVLPDLDEAAAAAVERAAATGLRCAALVACPDEARARTLARGPLTARLRSRVTLDFYDRTSERLVRASPRGGPHA